MKPKPEIWVIEADDEEMPAMLMALKMKIVEHFKDGGRVKVIHPDDSPAQELMQDFIFEFWVD